jgi:xanthine dehydrogenase accessory factor
MARGGRVSYFIEPLQPRERIIICGGGHIGKALFAIIKNMGFRTFVIDSMDEYANLDRFPGADKIINSFDEEVLENTVVTDDGTYIVIVSRDHPTDFRLVRFFLNKPWNYLGVIASQTKAAILRKELKEEGFPEEKIEALVSPIGKPIGGSSPEEIAVSIAAQLVEKRNKG